MGQVEKEITPGYDPTIQALLDQVGDDWGDPVINREGLVPYGIAPLDRALYGIDIINGELDLIMGEHKNRKTTFVMNVIVNYMEAVKPKVKPLTIVDTLESGMPPKRYRDSLIAIMATRRLLELGHKPTTFCTVCNKPQCPHFGLSPEFLRYNTRTDVQVEAIKWAMDRMRWWPLQIYGPNRIMGNTRSLTEAMVKDNSRWERLATEQGAKIFVTDHVQQYQVGASATFVSDYEKQIQAVQAVSNVVSMFNVVCLMLSQVSLGSAKEVRQGAGELNAAGGNKASQEANVVFAVAYEDGASVMRITLQDSRKSGVFSIWHPLDITSGAFYGTPDTGKKEALNDEG